jgi:hypothetical protein
MFVLAQSAIDRMLARTGESLAVKAGGNPARPIRSWLQNINHQTIDAP